MNEILNHVSHLLHFDGLLHWCFLIALCGFLMGLVWIVVRVLLPLRALAKQAASIMEGKLPAFDESSKGIREIEQLRCSLHYMIGQIQTAQARELAFRHAITASQENERLRIAREIHDDTIQSLVLVTHEIERATQTVGKNEDNATIYLKNARNQLLLTIDCLRQMIANLRPTILDELGLVVAIEMLCEKYATIEFFVEGDVYPIDPIQELAVFRAAQEAIHNAERHAGANRIAVTLSYSEQTVTLEVLDDGTGFRVPQQLQEFAAQGHYGLIGIRERILHLGGQLNLISELATGTRVTIIIPALQNALNAA